MNRGLWKEEESRGSLKKKKNSDPVVENTMNKIHEVEIRRQNDRNERRAGGEGEGNGGGESGRRDGRRRKKGRKRIEERVLEENNEEG